MKLMFGSHLQAGFNRLQTALCKTGSPQSNRYPRSHSVTKFLVTAEWNNERTENMSNKKHVKAKASAGSISNVGTLIRKATIGSLATLLMVSISTSTTMANDTELRVPEVTKMISSVNPATRDAAGWAQDMLSVMATHHLPANRENVCAAVAIIDQESRFSANPTVPGLGKMSVIALNQKLANLSILGIELKSILEENPSPKDSFMARIGRARTERDLDLTYRDAVANLVNKFGINEFLATKLATDIVENQNSIRTIGSMQVSVNYALDTMGNGRVVSMQLPEIYHVRDTLYTRKGGMYFGILRLLGYQTNYTAKIFRFADYNAGRYSSRNAAFQKILGELSSTSLPLDGDLLVYGKGQIAEMTASKSELALQNVSKRLSLGLTDTQIRNDLLLEKQHAFINTVTFQSVRGAYLQLTHKQPPFAVLPAINLTGVKLGHKMSTGDFARSVDRHYQRCMAVR